MFLFGFICGAVAVGLLWFFRDKIVGEVKTVAAEAIDKVKP